MTTLAGLDEAVALGGPLALERGGSIPGCTVGLRRIGDPDAPAVLVLGGISATRRVVAVADEAEPGWWEPVVSASQVLAGGAVQVVGADFLAGDGLSTAPAPEQRITTGDQAAAIVRACRAASIERLHAVVGASYGGMVALALARWGAFAGRVIAISAADRSHPMASASRWIQREIVRLGEAAGRPADGVALARALAMTTYRTAEEFRDRFGTGPEGAQGVTAYLAARGASFAGRWTAERFHQLSESLDLHRIDPATLCCPVILIGVSSDALVPPWQLQDLQATLGSAATLHLLDSPWGHDAFLKEPAAIARLIDATLTPTLST